MKIHEEYTSDQYDRVRNAGFAANFEDYGMYITATHF